MTKELDGVVFPQGCDHAGATVAISTTILGDQTTLIEVCVGFSSYNANKVQTKAHGQQKKRMG